MDEDTRPIEETETLGQRIRRIRQDRGMSLAKVVRDDFSRAFLNQVEMGKTRPSIRLLRVIAERLGTEVEYLLEGHEAGVDRELAVEKGRVLLLQGESRRALLALKLPWQEGKPPPAVAHSVYDDWDYADPRPVDWVPCPATMVRRTALGEVGLMDERFRLYFDDVDISLRMHLGGWEVWCVPEAEIVHYERRASLTVMSPAWRWHLISLCKFAWKHRGFGPPGGTPQVRRRPPPRRAPARP